MNESRKYDVILFDLEGTLVDFQWQLNPAVKEALELLEKYFSTPNTFGDTPSYASIYNKTRDLIKDITAAEGERVFGELDQLFNKYDYDALSRWVLYPDVETMLKKLSGLGCRCGIISNCGSQAVNAVLRKFEILDYFETVITRDDVEYIKPYAEGLQLALTNLKAPLQNALFVGDSVNDIQAAKNLSMRSCFLEGGESHVSGEKGSGAEYTITVISDLPSAFFMKH